MHVDGSRGSGDASTVCICEGKASATRKEGKSHHHCSASDDFRPVYFFFTFSQYPLT